jgi:ankyrin repeat protein
LLVSGQKSSALHKACFDGSKEIVQMLLEKGAPLDGRDDQGFTPLLAAASQRHFELMKMLLELGANPSLSTDTQSALLHYLIRTDPPLT